ncbi:hypothetical protein LUZ61_011700 [Rhynchospora tenuis]|uniref:Uncharacterized protein n=1 Tax=Rhynchospora tenuis TaxID=198213 RepID=A0AAD6F0P7_9POAL|nr:hypothetical protein LUZ61_011700 [Rhynchospora tenuis]
MPSSSAAQRQHVRINLTEIKGKISKRLGPDRSNRYFTCLNQFLSKKLTKQEFNKQCLSLFGHENIQLHNTFIRSILKNSLLSKTPPVQNYHDKTPVKNSGASIPSLWCNGGLPTSPRKVRTGGRERRFKDPGLVGPNGLVGFDGNSNSVSVDGPIKENGLLHNKEDSADQNKNLCSKREPIEAPLGIPFCRASVGGARLPSYAGFSSSVDASTGISSCSSLGELFNIDLIRNRIESIAKREGLAVGTNCAELLQRSLDVYLTRLISSATNLTGSVKRPNSDQNTITLEDFTLAMQLNPRQLGENAPELIERMSMRLFEKRDEYDKRR